MRHIATATRIKPLIIMIVYAQKTLQKINIIKNKHCKKYRNCIYSNKLKESHHDFR